MPRDTAKGLATYQDFLVLWKGPQHSHPAAGQGGVREAEIKIFWIVRFIDLAPAHA